MDWIQKNFRTIIYISFLIPILLVAFVSISHVTTWYGLANPMTWAIYLSVGIEIAALSALAAISAQMGKKVYVPFGIVTLIQFIGNIFFAYQYIDVSSEQFRDWVELVDPIVGYVGVESGNVLSHKRFLALFSGGMLPIISLSFLHMLVKFEEDDKKKRDSSQDTKNELPNIDIEELSKEIGKREVKYEDEKYTPSSEELERLELELRRLNDLKFGTLTEDVKSDPDYEVIIEKVEDEPVQEIVQEIVQDEPVQEPIQEIVQDEPVQEPVQEIVQEEPVQETILVGPQGEQIFEETISEIEVEPDFYKEEEADYSLEEDNKTVDNIKRLSYFRSR